MKIVVALLSLVFLMLPINHRSQSVETNKNKKTNKQIVSVPVTVSDRDGHYIPDLKREDFTVYQDGIKQNIAFFAKYDEPVNVALLLDSSGSTDDVLKEIKDAAKDFINLLNREDKCLIATFDSQVKILNPFTSNQQTLKNSLDKIRSAALGGTLMYRAAQDVIQNSFADVQGRKVIVLLTDGKDFGSAVTKDELLNQLEESDILIYTVFYKTGDDSKSAGEQQNEKAKKAKKKKKPYTISISTPVYEPTAEETEEIKLREKTDEVEAIDALKKISDATAGRFYVSDTPKLREVFKKVAGELRQQYRIGYNSNDAATDTAVHDIIVKVNRPNAVVIARGKFRGKQL